MKKEDIKINYFMNKKQVFSYIVDLFFNESNLILVRGSTAKRNVRNFSDFDVEVYQTKIKKPYYEIAFVNKKPILITVYFYKYRKGNKIKEPEDVRVLYGDYNDLIKPDFNKENYNYEEKIMRECQLVVDNFFNYLRNGNIKNLEAIQKKIK